jgi:hypothetical protein
MKYLLAILLLFTLPIVSTAETVHTVQDEISISVTLEPTEFTVGDPIKLQIEATSKNGVQLSLLNDGAFGPFVVTDQSTMLDIPSNEGRQWYWSMRLDTFDGSATEVADIIIHWTNSSGQTGNISVDPIKVHVNSVAGDTLQDMNLRDIRSSVPLLSSTWWPTIIAVGSLCVVLLLLSRLIFHKKKPLVPPHIKAANALQTLRDTDLEVQQFYTTISNIVRIYIEERFQISATGQTTREFLIAEKENPKLEHVDRKALADFLVAADLVKFARFEPNTNTWDDAIVRAEQFVTNTAPSVEQTRVEVAA